jgi:uncharacterized protein
MHAIADTGYLVALIQQNDQHHKWAKSVAPQLRLPLLTCEAVLAETAFHLGSSAYPLAMLQRGAIRIAFDCASHIEHLHDLAIRYEDRHPDLVDLCVIRMSELYPRHAVITVDEDDFRAYRRNNREVIPLICPPHR